MYDKYHTLVLGLVTAIGIGCAGPSSLKRVGNPENGDKAGMVTATSSKYTFLHMEWGNDSIGSLAHKNGIRYVLNANHRKIGLPLFGKNKITIHGLPNEAAFQEWRADKREPSELEAKAEVVVLKKQKADKREPSELEAKAEVAALKKWKAYKRERAELEAITKAVASLERRKKTENLAMAKVVEMLEKHKTTAHQAIAGEAHSFALSQKSQ